MVPATKRERADMFLVVKPRLVTQKVTSDFSVCNIMKGVMFLYLNELV